MCVTLYMGVRDTIYGATVVQEVEKSFSNQKVASSIPTVEVSLSKTLNP